MSKKHKRTFQVMDKPKLVEILESKEFSSPYAGSVADKLVTDWAMTPKEMKALGEALIDYTTSIQKEKSEKLLDNDELYNKPDKCKRLENGHVYPAQNYPPLTPIKMRDVLFMIIVVVVTLLAICALTYLSDYVSPI